MTNDNDTPIKVIFNTVYFYSEIYSERCPDLIEAVLTADKNLLSVNPTGKDPIMLYIQSPGGDMFSSLLLADWLGMFGNYRPIHSVVSGLCASGGTLLSVACAKRYMLPNSFMMIHQMSSEMWGTYEEYKSQMNFMDMAMEKMISIYSDNSKMNKKQIRDMLKTDSWFDAEKCLELGLIDEILR